MLAVTILYKGNKKPKIKPSSYKPICVLPVIGKLLEIRYETDRIVNKSQYGLKKKNCMENEINKVLNVVKGMTTKYILLILIDISNAFFTIEWNNIKT
ncbi:hypothetical protein PR048_013379, partial [Dryococelus australis]